MAPLIFISIQINATLLQGVTEALAAALNKKMSTTLMYLPNTNEQTDKMSNYLVNRNA